MRTEWRVRELYTTVRAIGVIGLLAAVLLGGCSSAAPGAVGSRPSDHSPVRSAAAPTETAAGGCTSRDARRQRSPIMPAPQRATRSVQLGPGLHTVGGHSPDLLPAPPGADPKVTASTAWATADLPIAGGGTPAIVLGTYPGEVPDSPHPVKAWLVYASGVAITDGYPWPAAPPVYGIKGTCAFGYLVVSIDATTGKVLQEGYDINP